MVFPNQDPRLVKLVTREAWRASAAALWGNKRALGCGSNRVRFGAHRKRHATVTRSTMIGGGGRAQGEAEVNGERGYRLQLGEGL